MKKLWFFIFILVLNPCYVFSYKNKEIDFQKGYQYDIYGNLIGIVYGTKAIVDPLNRVIEIKNGLETLVQYEYDAANDRTKMKDATGITSYFYDDLNRLIKITYPTEEELSYEYDLSDRVTKIVYPNKKQVEYGYDKRGRLISVKSETGEINYEYDDTTNLLKKEIHPHQFFTEYTYDSLFRVVKISHKKSATYLLAEFHYTYDEKNNIASKEKVFPGVSQKEYYTYDQSNRLVRLERPDLSFETFIYDAIGNILEKTTEKEKTLYKYDSENRLVKANETRYDYDDKGNLIKKSSKAREVIFQYDANNHLIKYIDDKNVVFFTYDGDGNRISKNVNGKISSYIYDPNSVNPYLLMESDSLGNKKAYFYGLSLFAESTLNKNSFFLLDLLGKELSLVLDQTGNIQNSYRYKAGLIHLVTEKFRSKTQ